MVPSFTSISILVVSGLNLIALSMRFEIARSIADLCMGRVVSPLLSKFITLPDRLENFSEICSAIPESSSEVKSSDL